MYERGTLFIQVVHAWNCTSSDIEPPLHHLDLHYLAPNRNGYCCSLGTQTHPGYGVASFNSWVPSNLLMKSCVRTTCAQGRDKQESDCKVDGTHMQPDTLLGLSGTSTRDTSCRSGCLLRPRARFTAMIENGGFVKDTEKQANKPGRLWWRVVNRKGIKCLEIKSKQIFSPSFLSVSLWNTVIKP